MKAVRVNEFGGPEVLHWEDGVPEPSPGPGEVLIKVAGAGMNFADQSRRRGTYPGGPAPTTLGMEAGGTVASVGPGVSEFEVGDNVMARVAGAQAEYVAAREADVFPAPEGVDPIHAGGIPLVFLTAYHILRTRADVQPGDRVLVHAAASGVGTAAIQLAKHWGASVIATASTEEKLELARSLGASHTINYANDDFPARVKDIIGEGGVEVILDSVGRRDTGEEHGLPRRIWPAGNLRQRLGRSRFIGCQGHLQRLRRGHGFQHRAFPRRLPGP